MEREEFENVAQTAFDALPAALKEKIENVQIIIEEMPSRETAEKMGMDSTAALLGLYEGIPLTKRGGWYGMTPVLPDRITLYKRNIERVARSEEALRSTIRDVLIHEIAHYYGMDEDEVRRAGY
jgi:predicted Zn-dependent protease with MMP-like domain